MKEKLKMKINLGKYLKTSDNKLPHPIFIRGIINYPDLCDLII